MLDAIALYFRYQSSCIISLRIVTTDLDLLSCTSRKGKTDSDLIRNTLLLWNNVVLCAIFKRKRVWFRFLHQYAVFCVVLKSLDDLFFSCEFALRFINQITVFLMILSSALMNSRFAVDFDLREREKFWFSIFDLRRSHLWSYWVEWELVLIVQLCSITCWSIWYIICFGRSLLPEHFFRQCFNMLMFSIFIQLKMRHDYFKSYLHQLSENNLNKCYKICNAR